MTSQPNEFVRYCCELLSTVGPCVARRMFGGYSLSTDGLTLAILADLGLVRSFGLKPTKRRLLRLSQRVANVLLIWFRESPKA